MRQVVASQLHWRVGFNYKLKVKQVLGIHCACNLKLWWQNNFGITLSQLFEHRYHVMHIRLPDKHNVGNHLYLEVFLSEQSFPSLSMSCCSSSTDCYFVVFQDQLAANSNFIPAADIVQSYAQGFFCQYVLSMIMNRYFPLQSLKLYLCQKSCSIQISYHVNFRNMLLFYLICQ